MEAWLITGAGDKVPLSGGLSLGRSPQNNLVLPGDPRVSRRHALIHQQGANQFWLVDLGSANGVFHNGHRIRQPVQLKDNDRIEIGSNVFIFKQTEAPAEDASSQDGHLTTAMVTVPDVHTHPLWLLVADIEGFSVLSQQIPGDELSRIVGRWILACKEILEANSGIINNYTGDGFLAYWPTPNNPSEAIARTLTALKERRAAESVPFRVVVHFGDVTVNNNEELIGADVNYVFRMEKLAASLKMPCLVSAPAAERLKAHLTLQEAGRHTLAGFPDTYEFFKL